MSEYKVKDYISKKFADICKETTVMKAYNLGLATGMLEIYKDFKRQIGQEDVDKYFKKMLEGDDEFNVIFRTMVGLYNDDTNSKVESMLNAYDEFTRSKEMTDEHRDLIEEFVEYLRNKNAV